MRVRLEIVSSVVRQVLLLALSWQMVLLVPVPVFVPTITKETSTTMTLWTYGKTVMPPIATATG